MPNRPSRPWIVGGPLYHKVFHSDWDADLKRSVANLKLAIDNDAAAATKPYRSIFAFEWDTEPQASPTEAPTAPKASNQASE